MTLIDFMNFKRKASDAAAKAMVKAGLKMSVAKAKKLLFDEYIKDIEGNVVFERFLKHYKQFNEKILAAAINSYLVEKYKSIKPYPKVRQTLNKIKQKRIKIAIVTDAPRLKAYMRLDQMGIADMFDVVVGKEDTGRLKPSKMPFKAALKQLNVKATEAMHVGDWPERDIVGAKRVGMKTCLAKYGYHIGKYIKADYEINGIEELLGIIKNG